MDDERGGEIPAFTKRRLQAQVIKPIWEEMVAEIGEPAARRIIERAIRKAALAEAADLAARAPGGETSMRSFVTLYDQLYESWKAEGVLEVEILRADDEHFDFDVTHCGYVQMYRDAGLGDIAPLLSCNRDGVFCQGYDARIELVREQTIMGGAPRCTFRYRYRRDGDTG